MAVATPARTIDELNDAPAAHFAVALAPWFEGAPSFLARLATARPFASVEAMFDRARSIAHAMPEESQIELIDAHPRLGAPPGSVSRLSYVEQGYGQASEGSMQTGTDVAVELDRLNAAYEAVFGFRYCVFVAGRSRAELLPGFEAALNADRKSEIDRALDAVVDIAIDRFRKASSSNAADAS